MKKLNFNFEILDLEEKSIGNAGKLLGNCLVAPVKGDALKFYDWAVKIHKGEDILVDNSDFKKIYEFISGSENMFLISKAQLMKYMDSLKEEEKS